MKISPAVIGFIKLILSVAVLAVVSYLADAAHITGILNPTLATVVAGLFAGLESSIKAKSYNQTALFGAVSVKQY